MPVSPATEPESSFVCDCGELMRSACAEEPFYKEHEGKRFCVLHFPSKEKSADFRKALKRKLNNKDFDFRGVWFPDDVSFLGSDFSAEANFRFATFSGRVSFTWASFVDYVKFAGTKGQPSFSDTSSLDFQFAMIEKPRSSLLPIHLPCALTGSSMWMRASLSLLMLSGVSFSNKRFWI